MIEVVLDTNIYTSDPWRGRAGFNALVRLAKSGKLRLHIPYLVQKEFVSQQIEIHEKHINSINNSIAQLQRRVTSDLTKKLDGVRENFSKIQDDLIIYPESEFTKWIKEVDGVVHLVSASHGAQVIEDYFEGALPYKSKKSREDIPDSFIWQTISDLASQIETLYVVANDKKIRDACDNVKNIITFETLDDFIKSDVCRAVQEEESVKENIARLFRYLPAIFAIRQEEIQEQLIEILEDTSIQSERLIPNISRFATIKNVEGLKQDVVIEGFTSAQYYGDGVVVVPFSTQAEIVAEYELSPVEYHSLSVKRVEQILISEREEARYKAEETFSLGVVGTISIKVNSQKILEYNLSEEDIKTLIDGAELNIDSIDQKELIDWDPIQNRWEQQFLELVRFKAENGHSDVPRKHPLGQWVSNQRQRNRIGSLAKERVERLNKIGFIFITRSRGAFDDYVEQLLEYKNFYGHMNVPQKYRQLGRWVNDQRTKKTNGTLSQEYEDGLNKIGFIWNAIEARWNQRLSELREFHEKFGHFEVPPQINEYPKLYAWSTKLRRKKPTSERLAKLNSIGYDWNIESRKGVKSREVDEVAWNEKLQSLKEYYEKNSHFDVAYKEDKSLYNWLFKLRSRKPSEERLEKLSGIGFHWEPKKDKRKPPATWDDNFNLIKLHFETTGNFDISSTKQKNLYNWLYKLKRKKPTEAQIEKLKSISFDWEKEKEGQ